MRAASERLLRSVWSGEGGAFVRLVAPLLTPLSWVWRSATAVRNRRFDRSAPERVAGLVVVSVGNLAVGGTGKTPLASWIAARYAAAGARPALLLSGYGEDEVLLHRRRTPDVPVLADRDRVAAARAARAGGAQVVVLDDGFQHRRLARDLDLVVLAAEDPFPGPLLPRGPYRERPAALGRADAVVVTRRSATLEQADRLVARVHEAFPGLVGACVRLEGGRWTDLDGAEAPPPRGDVLAVTAIARPAPFLEAVRRAIGGPVEAATFADHHPFDGADARRLRRRAAGRPIVVTEKDAVKLVAWRELLGPVHVLAQDIRFDWGEQALATLLDAAVAAGVP